MKNAAAALVMLFMVNGAFAAVELTAGPYIVPDSVQSVEFDSGRETVFMVLPVGYEVKSTFFFGDVRPVNLGLNIGLSGDFFVSRIVGKKFRLFESGWNAAFVCGPALSVNFSRVSLFVSPGFQAAFTAVNGYDEDETSGTYTVDVAFDFGAHIDAGCKVWFLRKETFALGMNFGADYAVSGGQYGKYTLDESDDRRVGDELLDMPLVQRLKVYAGIAFRFGK